MIGSPCLASGPFRHSSTAHISPTSVRDFTNGGRPTILPSQRPSSVGMTTQALIGHLRKGMISHMRSHLSSGPCGLHPALDLKNHVGRDQPEDRKSTRLNSSH